MQDLRDDVAGLKARLRLQMLMLGGLLAALVLSAGGADVVARTLVESDAWKVRTKKADLATVVDRIVVTTDVDNARIKVLNANIELARQATLPSSGLVEGMLGYDSTAHALKFYNGTSWVASGGGGGGTATLGKGFAGGRLFGSGTFLSYNPYVNNIVEVNNEYVVISAMSMQSTTTLIDAAGNNTALAMQDGVTYYAYISNSLVTWAPKALRCSAAGNLYGNLGTTGNALNWRCVGMIRLSGGQFQDSDAIRWVFNSYNKIQRRLFSTPAYVDDGLTTTQNNNNTAWVGINNGIGSRLMFLSDTSNPTEIFADITVKMPGGECWLGIADNNQPAQVQTLVTSSLYTPVHMKLYASQGMGDHSHYCDLQLKTIGGTATILVDAARVQPLVPDSKVTVFYGSIWN